MTGQPSLFALPPIEVPAAPARPEHQAVAAALPRGVRLGTMSWNYPGWAGIVYGANPPVKDLAAHGLTACAKHPLLRAAEIDRSLYGPLSPDTFRDFAKQTPDDFRFLVKAHGLCTNRRIPDRARYGKNRGEANALYLDASHASDAVVGPLHEGLGAKAAALVFQFPPQDVGEPPEAFAARLHDFLRRLPAGVTYAVELRNRTLLTPEYATALADVGAVHCHNVWPGMPPLLHQVKRIPPAARRPLIVRWLMRDGDDYERAGKRASPFHRIVEEDPENRWAIASLVVKADAHGVPAFVFVDNKAEGCAPESIALLATAIVEARAAL